MKNTHLKAVVLDVLFGRGDHYERFMRAMDDDPDVESNVLRGRVTPHGSWVRIELRAPATVIDDIVRDWRDETVSFTALPKSAA
jgi:hypothetical protein